MLGANVPQGTGRRASRDDERALGRVVVERGERRKSGERERERCGRTTKNVDDNVNGEVSLPTLSRFRRTTEQDERAERAKTPVRERESEARQQAQRES